MSLLKSDSISKDVQPKGRPVLATIDCSAFQHNISLVESLAPNAETIVVIKADAYGHGMVELARCAGDRAVAVASSDEARRLIDAGIENPVWVLEGPFDASCLQLSRSHQITWVIHSDWQLDLLEGLSLSAPLSLWLKIDTGMHRLGFHPDKLAGVLARITAQAFLNCTGVMTHFANSDLSEGTPESEVQPSVVQQIACFDRCLADSDVMNVSQPLAQSLANSGAILHYPATHRSVVRPGIMLYGASPMSSISTTRATSASAYGLKSVMHLSSAVMALRTVAAGESVGYGSSWTAERESLIATVAVGYGDGYPRHAPNGTPVAVNQTIAPLAGRVSMDMITVDVSDIPGVKVGDPVELWGALVSADEVATMAGTISYELFTSLTSRVPRRYLS